MKKKIAVQLRNITPDHHFEVVRQILEPLNVFIDNIAINQTSWVDQSGYLGFPIRNYDSPVLSDHFRACIGFKNLVEVYFYLEIDNAKTEADVYETYQYLKEVENKVIDKLAYPVDFFWKSEIVYIRRFLEKCYKVFTKATPQNFNKRRAEFHALAIATKDFNVPDTYWREHLAKQLEEIAGERRTSRAAIKAKALRTTFGWEVRHG